MPKRWHGKEDSELVRRESETLFQLKDLQVSAIVCAVFQLSEETPCISAAVAFLAELKEECEYLVSLAKPHIKRSTVVDSSTRGSKDSRFRQRISFSLEHVTSITIHLCSMAHIQVRTAQKTKGK